MKTSELIEATERGATLLAGHPLAARFVLIGSSAYLPAEQCEDVDYLVLVPRGRAPFDFVYAPEFAGFQLCGGYDAETGAGFTWTAIRQGPLNLIVTSDEVWFERFITAMRVCQYLEVSDKLDRVVVCKMVRDGKDIKEAFAAASESVGVGL